MRLLFVLVTIILLSEAKKTRPKKKTIVRANDDLPHEADVHSEQFIPVPFGHIYKEGFQPNLKLPVDLLELDRKFSKDVAGKKIGNKDKSIRVNQNEKPKGLDRPKDLFAFDENEEHVEEKVGMGDVNNGELKHSRKDERKTWHDLVVNHARSFSGGRKDFYGPPRRVSVDTNANQARVYPSRKLKEQFLSRTSFDLEAKGREEKRYNWTTCDEFGRNANFHPNDVVNIDWVPFYTWSSDEIRRTVAFVHRFSIPTIKLVQKYKKELGMFVNKTLDWNSPKLHLKSNTDMLLIASDRRGQFDAIPYNNVPSSMKQSKVLTLPLVSLRLKILDPYLAMMFCDYQYATIMAISGYEPSTVQEVRSAAATLKFQGKGCPVARDLEAEKMAAKLERENKIRIEKDKLDLTIE